MRRYAIVVEDAGTNLAAYVPDLPGCVATGETLAEVERLITPLCNKYGHPMPKSLNRVGSLIIPATGPA